MYLLINRQKKKKISLRKYWVFFPLNNQKGVLERIYGQLFEVLQPDTLSYEWLSHYRAQARGKTPSCDSFCCDPTGKRWTDRWNVEFCWSDHNPAVQMDLQAHTHHIIQVTKTIVASLNELKKRISSSPSWPSFFRATPKTRANITSPRMFIPSISVPKGICRDKKKTKAC